MTAPWFDTRASVRGWLVVLAVVAALVVLFVTTGRGGRLVSDGPVVRHENGWGLGGSSGMDAMVGGVIDFSDGCLLLDGHAVIWPDDTSWDDEHQVVRLPGGERLEPGWTVTGAGGVSDGPPEAASWERFGLAGCLAAVDGVVQFNSDSDLEVGAAYH